MSTEPPSQAARVIISGSPGSADSITAASTSDPNDHGRATAFSTSSATPSTNFSRDIRKDPIPAPGAPGSASSTSSSGSPQPAAAASQPQPGAQPSATSGAGGDKTNGGKSMFDETPEEAQAKKDYLRKLASGNKDAIAQYEQEHKDAKSDPKLDTSKPVNPQAQMEVEQWGDNKDPVYNAKVAAKDDYYTPAKNEKEEAEEDVTVAATKLLLADPTQIAQAAKQAEVQK